jgi:hypothetical protein
MSNKIKKQTKEFNKLTNEEETINDLRVKDSEQVVGGVDTSGRNALASVTPGSVQLRAGNSVKQIAAGGQDTAG